ncbi:MAG: ATP-binding protein [Candidatus Nanoarchaeia archaeon]|nr:ATP-binding protein [Candidatus Nanoarchaeia archaeon]
MNLIGNVVGGSVGEHIVIRLKSDSKVDVGDIIKINSGNDDYFGKITNVKIFSSVPEQFIHEIAGQKLEHGYENHLFDREDRFFRIAEAKVLKIMRKNVGFVPPRSIPEYFSQVNVIDSSDFSFMQNNGRIPIGFLRLGTKEMDTFIVKLKGEELISHHILVVATTGKGKSNFAKVFIRGLMMEPNSSAVVFDPHAEYYGEKNIKGLRDHPKKSKVLYFTPRTAEFPGSESLVIHADELNPSDFMGVVNFSDAQVEAMDALYKRAGRKWLAYLINTDMSEIEKSLDSKVMKATIASLKRKVCYAMELEDEREGLVFTTRESINNMSMFKKVINAVMNSKIIIVDTSIIGGESEKLISGAITRRIYNFYRKAKQQNPDYFKQLPETMVLFEEAPRVLGKEALAGGSNVFEKIAREGRKFKVGLCAITQMPHLIPKEILSQMNTKIILGLPSSADRTAVIESAPQNINDESREIQMLDRGEAIITSAFTDFPMPVKIFNFSTILEQDNEQMKEQKTFIVGME